MAENEGQQQGNQAAGAASAGQGAGTTVSPAATGGGEPVWGQKFKSPDEMWASYNELERKLGSQGNELGTYRQTLDQVSRQNAEYQKAVEAWDKWYKDTLAPHWDDVDKFLKTRQGKQVAAQVAQATGAQASANGDWAADWEQLTPAQQAQRLRDISLQEISAALTPAITEWQKRFVDQVGQQIQQKEAYFNNYLNLYRKVMDMRMKDPSLDIDSVLDQAVKVLGGQIDPIELGKQLATMSTDRETYAKQLVEQARKDWELEQKNKQMAAVTPTNGQPPIFKLPSAGSAKAGLATQREQVAKRLLETYGPGVF